jgi:hypothetical protein
MKNSSRRSFGKQLAGTLISLPVLASVAEVYGQKRVKSKVQARDFREHNTPPPVLIAEGSLTIETTAEFGATPTPAGAGRKRHFMDLGPRRIKHIRIVDGSGEMLFRKHNPPADVEIRVLISHPGTAHPPTELRMGRAATNLYVDLVNEKELGNPDTLPDVKRTKRYKVRRGNVPLEFEAITVAAAAHPSTSILFTKKKEDLDSRLKEVRIMIWPE